MNETRKHLSKFWHDYTVETIYNRAIPNIMDGFKPIHRKVFYTALKKFGSRSGPMNTNAFSGAVKEISNYHHGDASLAETICKLTAYFSNNIPMFVSEANFGNKLNQASAAPRYTDVLLNKDYTQFMIMDDILNYTPQDDNKTHEPDFYFFSIPMALVNGMFGIAVGNKTMILPYNIKDIKKNVERAINKKPLKKMTPKFPEFTGNIYQDNNGVWFQEGIVEVENTTTVHIKELPTKYDRDSFISVLKDLSDSGLIHRYDDHSSDHFHFEVKIPREVLKQNRDRLIEFFSLRKAVSQHIKVLTPNGDEVIEFNTPEELIEKFVEYMLEYVEKFRLYKIVELKDKISKNKQRIKFIQYILSIDIRKHTIAQIEEHCTKILNLNINWVKEFMQMSILKLTKDSIDLNIKRLKEYTESMEKYSNISNKDLYKEMLANI